MDTVYREVTLAISMLANRRMGLGVFKSTTYREGLGFLWEFEWKNDQTEGLGIYYCKQNGFKAEGERSAEKRLLFGRRYIIGLLLTGHFNYSNGELYGIKTKIQTGSSIVNQYESKPFIFTVKSLMIFNYFLMYLTILLFYH